MFNTFWIKNTGRRNVQLTLNLTVPLDWKLIGEEQTLIHLEPGDSTLIPLRVAVSAMVRGDIGYSIVASLNDEQGNNIKNDYCFVKIPGVYDLSYKLQGSVSFLDPVERATNFSILVQNKGNRDETVNVLLDGNSLLNVGPEHTRILSQDYAIRAFSDTTLIFNVEQRSFDQRGRNMFPLTATLTSPHASTRRTLWFRSIESLYVNQIDALNKPLTVELNIQSLLDETMSPTYSATIFGRTLLKGNNDIYYYYRNYTSNSASDLYYKSRAYIGANLGQWNIEIGDNFRQFEGYLTGRGFYLSHLGKRGQYTALANKALNSDMLNAAIRSETPITKVSGLTLITGANYSQQASIDFRSIIGYGGIRHNYRQGAYKHSVQAIGAYNYIERTINGKRKHHEWGGKLSYIAQIGPTSHSFLIEHHTPLYYSHKAGYSTLSHRSTWYANENNRFMLQVNEQNSISPYISNDTILNTTRSRNGEYHLEHQLRTTRYANVFYGPLFRVLEYRTNNPAYRPGADLFKSHAYGAIAGVRLSLNNNTLFVVPRAEVAVPIILANPYPSDTLDIKRRRVSYQHFSLNVRSPHLSLITLFTMGPRNISDQLNYANRQTMSKRLIFIPSYHTYMLNEKLLFTASASYNNDLISKFSYTALTGKLECFFKYDWYFSVMMQYNMQRRTQSTENFSQYQTLYAEATIRKEFGFQQPRVKYHDVDMVFFKDFNGDQTQSMNEPGIKNVLVSIERVADNEINGPVPHNISSVELLSDNMGRVRVENLPEGLYHITYNPLGDEAGSYSKIFDNVEIQISKSGVHYFPFAERNKVFGRIIMNRSKLSGLGHIDISNIRITAADSRGNVFSTLTDKNGEFTLFAPSTDEYVVNVNNIFQENFDLRQNNFRVQFNGYKQFEVNYVFDEKVRQINFSQTATDFSPLDGSLEDLLENTQQIRRTTLRGVVKDAATLSPVRARINLLNVSNNTPVQSVLSAAQTGDFGMTFMAADEYILEVQADGYWHYSENLVLNQITTFMTLTREIALQPITIGSQLEANIQFEAGSAELTPNTVAELNRILRMLRSNSQIRVEAQGHTDESEQRSYPRLSEQRASAVAKYLREHGFANCTHTGKGSQSPIAPSNNEANRALNRRVEIVVIGR